MPLTRRTLLQSTALASASLLLPNPLRAADASNETPATQSAYKTRWEERAARKRAIARNITWLTHEPLDFLLRRGDHTDNEPAHYAAMLNPDNLKRMADAGVQWARLFFYKGFGLAYERPHIDQAKKAADLLHKLNLKVSLYFGGTMFIETFYKETPEAKNWEQRDYQNQPVPYGSQTFRRYACPNEPAYRDYLKKVLDVAINELHADEIAFDNIMLQAEPHSCRCPRCLKTFADFLHQRYPTEELATRRFGISDVTTLQPNYWETPDQPNNISEINDPVLQEWVLFRCHSLANYAGALHDMTKAMNPNTAVLLNIKGVYSFNRYWTNAIYHPLYKNRVDLISFDTGGYNERIDNATGALVTQVRSYKMARNLNAGCEDSLNDEVRAATHMAFGFQPAVATPAPFGSGAHNVFTPLIEFFREFNERYYLNTQPVTDVAILRSWPSMAYSINATSIPATLMEQVLIQHKIPFKLLFDEQLQDLGKYQMLILAGQECISDEQVDLFLSYVQNGGTLLLTGNAGTYNQWREKRAHKIPLLPARTEGKGKILYLPDIQRADKRTKSQSLNEDPEPGATPSKVERFSPPQWVLPTNHKEIADTITQNLPTGPARQTTAPLTTIAQLHTPPTTKETLAHFINFDRATPTPECQVTLRKQFDSPVTGLQLLTPTQNDPIKIDFTETRTHLTCTLPPLLTYYMLITTHA